MITKGNNINSKCQYCYILLVVIHEETIGFYEFPRVRFPEQSYFKKRKKYDSTGQKNDLKSPNWALGKSPSGCYVSK